MSQDQLYGLDKEIAEKLSSKYDPKREADARWYIETITGEKFASDDFQESLKSGVLLCKLMNKIRPQEPIKISNFKTPFKQMENIAFFLDRLGKMGVPTFDKFQTVDLYEGKNIDQVINAIFSLSRYAAAAGFDGPILGPKLATKSERNFTEEQLNQSKSMLPRLTAFVPKNDGPGPFGGRREIGGIYLENQDDADSNAAAAAIEAVSIADRRPSAPVVEEPVKVAPFPDVVEEAPQPEFAPPPRNYIPAEPAHEAPEQAGGPTSPTDIQDSYIDSYYGDDAEEVVIVEDDDEDVKYLAPTPRREE
ncbi:hypothetical protein HK101_006783 [Irineochytrium annulatum]|nr:hypothetical protein HK101_006783 [Irineochytrium annulatum]